MLPRLALLVVVAVAACAADPETAPPDACAAVDGAIFESRDALPYGENMQGPVLAPWHIRFANGAVDWRHDDVLHDRGTYTCMARAIEAVFPGASVHGSFDTAVDELTWDGEPYARCVDDATCLRAAGW